eukprot:3734870-Pleurochrysis_carterae.AAC.1
MTGLTCPSRGDLRGVRVRARRVYFLFLNSVLCAGWLLKLALAGVPLLGRRLIPCASGMVCMVDSSARG